MTREECAECEYLGEPFLRDERLSVKGCMHPTVMGGLGIWIARIKECPKIKDGEHE